MQNYENFSKKIKTLFIGKDLRYLPICQSTNVSALELIERDDYLEGTTIVTDYQTAGRGQQGNRWEAEKGENITLSVILTPHRLATHEQFFLNMAVTLAIYDFLQNFLENKSLLKIKWPNDLLYNKQKICGVLIQNIISGKHLAKSVVGIGVNINQKHFTVEQAVSLSQITNLMYDLPILVQKLLENLEKRYLQIQKRLFKNLQENYYACLYGYQEEVLITHKEEVVKGKILGVDSIGRLQMSILGKPRAFQFKEIQFLLDNM